MSKYIKNWFSNMLDMDTPLVYEGLSYRTVENFYMAMKTLDLRDRKMISKLSARDAKKYGRTVKLREDWEDKKKLFMLTALKHKFSNGTSWHKKLMDCKDEVIVEVNNWHDNIWGNCICERCRDIEGNNCLGKLLTFLRDNNESWEKLFEAREIDIRILDDKCLKDI